jgi:hypothetical protein
MTVSNRRRRPGADGLSPVTVPPVTILMEMAGYGSLTEWLARPLPKGHVSALSTEARRERKRAQVRLCKLKVRRARQLKKIAEADA